MTTITYQAAEREEETVSAFLMMVMEHGRATGLYGLLANRLKIEMKEVKYSLVNKAQTVIASLVLGCEHTKAINETLKPERAAARYLGLERFPDQSQINRYLTRFSEENVQQLGDIQLEMLVRQSQARQAVGWAAVDIDQCGLVANGKTYEFKHKGYFPRKRGEEGYQLSAAYLGAYDEALQLYLDPGNVHCSQRLEDLLRDSEFVLTQDNPALKVIYRLDAGYDTPTNRRLLLSRSSYFLLKAHDTRLARKLAQPIPLQDWIPVAELVHGTELTPLDGYRRLLYEFYVPEGELEYFLMYTNLPTDEFGIQQCFTFYNQRQTIEAFFAQSRQSYHTQNLRSRKFNAIYAFLRFVFLTHNLIHWTKLTYFTQTTLAKATTRTLVQQIARVRARWSWTGTFQLFICPSSHWAALLLEALQPRFIQLELPFAHLHKT